MVIYNVDILDGLHNSAWTSRRRFGDRLDIIICLSIVIYQGLYIPNANGLDCKESLGLYVSFKKHGACQNRDFARDCNISVLQSRAHHRHNHVCTELHPHKDDEDVKH